MILKCTCFILTSENEFYEVTIQQLKGKNKMVEMAEKVAVFILFVAWNILQTKHKKQQSMCAAWKNLFLFSRIKLQKNKMFRLFYDAFTGR